MSASTNRKQSARYGKFTMGCPCAVLSNESGSCKIRRKIKDRSPFGIPSKKLKINLFFLKKKKALT